MNSRERVLTALDHREPDRVPIDLGGHRSSGISAIAYAKLKKAIGIESGDIYVYDITMGGYESKTNYYCATATVWIKDTGLNDIEGATVYGSWSGATVKGDDEKDTGSNGKATLTSDDVKGGGTFTFTVTDVTATGYNYNSSLNNEDYDSITLP